MILKRITAAALSILILITNFALPMNISASEIKSNNEVSTEENDLEYSGKSSLGKLLADAAEVKTENENESEYSCKIYAAVMDKKKAYVNYYADIDCSLVVALYDEEDEKMLVSRKTEISASEEYAELSFEDIKLPDYYIIKVYMVDKLLYAPLSEVYINNDEKKEMKDFYSKTIEDFDSERVLNLDDKDDNNFLVYSKNTVLVSQKDEENILVSSDDEKGIYVFDKINDEIRSLKKDDILSYNDNTESPVILKVGNIVIDGSKATITSAETSLDEVFTYVKIKEMVGMEDAKVDTEGIPNIISSEYDEANLQETQFMPKSNMKYGNSRMGFSSPFLLMNSKAEDIMDIDLEFKYESDDDGIEYSGIGAITFKFVDNNKDIELNDDKYDEAFKPKVSISGSFTADLKLEAKLSVKFYLDTHEIKDMNDVKLSDIFSVEIKIADAFTFTGTLSGSIKEAIPLCNLSFMFKGFIVTFSPKFIVNINGELEVTANYTQTYGIKISKESGKWKSENISKPAEATAELKGEVSLEIGIDIGPKIKFLSEKLFNITTEISAVVVLTASAEILSAETSTEDGPRDKHICNDVTVPDAHWMKGCISFGIDLKFSLGLEVEFIGHDIIGAQDGEDADLFSPSLTWHLGNAYYSIYYDECGIGNCPHKQYYYELTVKDRRDKPLKNAEVKVTNYSNSYKSDKYITDEDGKVLIYLYNGTNYVDVNCEQYNSIRKQYVVDVSMEADSNTQNNSINSGDKNNVVHIDLSYEIGNKKDVVKINGESERADNIKLKDKTYVVAVKVQDSEGNPLENATLFGDYEYAKEDRTFAKYPIPPSDAVFMIDLPNGKYKLDARLKGYESTGGAEVVVDNADTETTIILDANKCRFIVEDQFGDPVVSATIKITKKNNDDDSLLTSKFTGKDGYYCENLDTGEYNLKISKKGFEDIEETFTVAAKGGDFKYEMQNNLRKQVVKVIDNDGNAMSGVSVYNYYDYLSVVKTDESGCVTLNLPVGETDLKLLYPGYAVLKPSITVTDSDNPMVTYTMSDGKSDTGTTDTDNPDNTSTETKWELSDGGKTLTITGKGEMTTKYRPSSESMKNVETIIIEDGITKIGPPSDNLLTFEDYVFSDFTNLKEITIPNSVTKIGHSMFSGCTGLTKITLSDSVTEIGYDAFYGCESLKEITIPDSVTTIGSEAFYGCTGLTEITLSDSLITIRKEVFSGCTSLTKIIIPNSVITIKESAFSGCESLKEITIPDSVTLIEAYAFSDCTGLTKITLSDSVTTIGDYAFSGCTGLTEITIPDSVTEIGGSAFRGCTGLTEITIPNGVTEIGYGTFSGCTGLTKITIPYSVKTIKYDAFSGCTGLTEITIPDIEIDDVFGKFGKCPIEKIIIADGSKEVNSKMICGRSTLKEVVIPDSVTTIGEKAFSGCTSLTEVIIPNSVITIGEYAFSGCTGLTEIITIPDSVTEIGYKAFNGCTGLTEITIPDIEFDNDVFYNCPIEKIIIADGSKEVNRKMIKENVKSTLKEVVIPDSVTTIGDYTFSGCKSLIEITISDSVTTIGKEAFKDCPIEKIIIADGSKEVNSQMICGESTLKEVVIPDSITTIGEYAFSGCTNLKEITIPDSVTTIGDKAFRYCSNLIKITIPDSVTTIGEEAFNDCTSLTEITILDSVTEIGNSAFSGCTGLTEITIPDSVTEIGNSAFFGCTGLTEITLSDSVTTIGEETFKDCTSLTEITIPDSVTTIEQSVFYDCTSLTEITIPDSVTTIGERAFYNCTGLTEITIPDSVITIEDFAFRSCTGLTEITLSDSVTEIGLFAFEHCKNLKEIIIPDIVTTIRQGTFYGCTSLTEITIPDSVTTIGEEAFSNCTGLTEITILDSVTEIGNSAFSGCTGLTEITIPDSVITIEDFAFSRCENLTEITIPNSVTKIGIWALGGNDSFKHIYYIGTEEQWNLIDKDINWRLGIAKIHFIAEQEESSYLPEVNALETEVEVPVAYAGNQQAEHEIEEKIYTETVSGLVSGDCYNVYVLKTSDTEDKFADDNIIYIKQDKADADGKIEFSFRSDEAADGYEVIYVHSLCGLTKADITIADLKYTGKSQEMEIKVEMFGTPLENNVDYTISEMPEIIYPGKYAVTFNGIGNYYGTVTELFEVICEHDFGEDDVCKNCNGKYIVFIPNTEETTETPEPKVIYGDVNSDGKVDLKDVLFMRKYLIGDLNTEINETLSDVNHDESVDIKDLILIKRYLVGSCELN